MEKTSTAFAGRQAAATVSCKLYKVTLGAKCQVVGRTGVPSGWNSCTLKWKGPSSWGSCAKSVEGLAWQVAGGSGVSFSLSASFLVSNGRRRKAELERETRERDGVRGNRKSRQRSIFTALHNPIPCRVTAKNNFTLRAAASCSGPEIFFFSEYKGKYITTM